MLKTIIVLPDGTEVSSGAGTAIAIRHTTLTECVNSGEELTIGSVCANSIEVSLITPAGSLSMNAGTEIVVYREDENARTKLGVFILEKPTRKGANTMEIVGYDRVSKLDKDLAAWLSGLSGWPYALGTFAGMVCTACGLTYEVTDIPNVDFPVQKFSRTSVTGRQLMQWIGEACGRFCRATPDGNIEFAWYEPSGMVISSSGSLYYMRSSLSYEDYETEQIGAVQIRLADSDAGAPWPAAEEGVNSYIISGNPILGSYITAELPQVLDNIKNGGLGAVTYTPCKVSIPATMTIHAGSIVQIVDINGKSITAYVMTKTQSGMKDTLQCVGSQRRDSSAVFNNRTPSQKAEDAANQLTQEELFKRLTNNGETQGIFLNPEDKKIYINLEYLVSKYISADLVKAGVLKSKDGESVVIDLDNGAADILGSLITRDKVNDDGIIQRTKLTADGVSVGITVPDDYQPPTGEVNPITPGEYSAGFFGRGRASVGGMNGHISLVSGKDFFGEGYANNPYIGVYKNYPRNDYQEVKETAEAELSAGDSSAILSFYDSAFPNSERLRIGIERYYSYDGAFFQNRYIRGLTYPSNPTDAVNKEYVDGKFLSKSDGDIRVDNLKGLATSDLAWNRWFLWDLEDANGEYPAAIVPGSSGRQDLGHPSHLIASIYANTYRIGTWDGNTIAVGKGGTGATTAEAARANLGAAPAGYGLGEAAPFITDCNTATKNGWYRVTPSTLNMPFAADGWLHVVAYDDWYAHQTLYSTLGGGAVVERFVTNGAGGSWEYDNPPMGTNTEYRTTERWKGHPVFKKLGSDGIMYWRRDGDYTWRTLAELYGGVPSTGGTVAELRVDNANSSGYVALSEDGEGGTIRISGPNNATVFEIDAFNDETLRIHTAVKRPADFPFRGLNYSARTGIISGAEMPIEAKDVANKEYVDGLIAGQNTTISNLQTKCTQLENRINELRDLISYLHPGEV